MPEIIKDRYNRIAGIYDILEYPLEKGFSRWRKKLQKEARGKTLEIGIGTGRSIQYYPDGIDLIGIDFSERMIEKARQKAAGKENIQLVIMDAEDMIFEDNTFDTVVTSCVFCSVPDPVKGLMEIRRVCKNWGKVLMLEHVRSQRKIIGKTMDILNPIPLKIYGANINRITYDNLIKAGFNANDIKVENIWSDIVKIFRITNKK